MKESNAYDTIVIGAGQAGLASAAAHYNMKDL